MTMTAPVQTLGPVDTGAGLRAKLYAGLTALLGIPAVIQILGIITADQSTSITQILTGVLGLLGAGGLSLAATKANKQSKNGTFDPAPLPPVNPVDDAFTALNKIKQQIDDTVNHAQTQVVQATAMLQGAAAAIPGGAGITKAVLAGPVGDLVQSMFDRGGLTAPAPGQQR